MTRTEFLEIRARRRAEREKRDFLRRLTAFYEMANAGGEGTYGSILCEQARGVRECR